MKSKTIKNTLAVLSATLSASTAFSDIDWTSALYWTNYGATPCIIRNQTANDYQFFSYWDSANGKPYAATVEAGKLIGASDKLVFNQSYVKSGTSSNYVNTAATINSSDVMIAEFSTSNFNVNGGSGSGLWTMNSLTIKNISAGRAISFNQANDYGNLALYVKNDVSLTGGANKDSVNNFCFGGLVTLASGATTSKGLRSFTVDGNLDISGRAFVLVNTLDKACTGQVFNVDNYANASTKISGVVRLSLNGTGVPVFTLNFRNYATISAQTITSIGGLSGTAGTVKSANNSNDKGATALVFTNSSGMTTFSGNIQETDSASMQMKLVMMGTSGAVQKLVGGASYFTGGIEVISGTLAINTNNSSWDKSKSGDIIMASTITGNNTDGRLWATKGIGNSAPIIYGNDLYWSAGTIIVENSGITGCSLISLNGTIVDDGMIDGMLRFEFNKSGFEFSGDSEYHLVEWDNINNKTSLTASDFTAVGTLIEEIKNSFNTDFSIRNDGLYVSFTSVPEASTYAVILGFAALALALVRRKK